MVNQLCVKKHNSMLVNRRSRQDKKNIIVGDDES